MPRQVSPTLSFVKIIHFLSAFGIGDYDPTTSLSTEICWITEYGISIWGVHQHSKCAQPPILPLESITENHMCRRVCAQKCSLQTCLSVKNWKESKCVLQTGTAKNCDVARPWNIMQKLKRKRQIDLCCLPGWISKIYWGEKPQWHYLHSVEGAWEGTWVFL